jgi:hypothetical protein
MQKKKIENMLKKNNSSDADKIKVTAAYGSVGAKHQVFISEFGKATSLLAKFIVCQLKDIPQNNENNVPQNSKNHSGGSKKKIYTGKRGGKYYIKNGRKIYI